MGGLLETFLDLISSWDNIFPQLRTALRAKAISLSLLLALGRKTLTRALVAAGRDDRDWSAEYRLFSRCGWSICDLFRPLLIKGCNLVKDPIIAAAYDDTLVRKRGKKILGSSWQRDPLSPPFHVNFVWGMRYLQASLLLPLYQQSKTPARAIPVQFEQLPKFKKPRKKAPVEEWVKYKALTKAHNTSTCFVKELRYLRNELNLAGFGDKELLAVCDGSFCNATCLSAEIPNTQILARARKNARLSFRAKPSEKGRFYSVESFTPEEARKEEGRAYQNTSIYYGGAFRPVRYKEVNEVYWQGATKRKPLRLIVVAPTPYGRGKSGNLMYRQPAYLLTTDLTSPVTLLMQKYFDRWQIEVNFKEEKSLMGLGHAQVWSPKSIPRFPAFVVGIYSALLLSSVLRFKDRRKDPLFEKLPKWRNQEPTRPSCLDLVTIARKEMLEKPEMIKHLGVCPEGKNMIYKAAA